MGVPLKEVDVATVARMAPRSVRRRACELRSQATERVSKNGRRARVFELSSLAPALQREFLDRKGGPEANTEQPALDLTLTLPKNSNLNIEDHAEAERRYQILEPLIRPEAFRLIWCENHGRRSKVLEGLAAKNAIGRRTLYSWLKSWQKSGLPGLVPSDRADKGRPRSLNAAALDFILCGALARPGSYGALSVREIHRAYQEERLWRAAHAGKPLNKLELQKYVRCLGEDERLLPNCQLPEASYETFRRWYGRISEPVKAYAREGETAFFNEHEVFSYRNLAQVRPLDFVVMDHRMLDVFCLAPTRGGWKLVRPYLTGAIDMRTRKWLAWVIVQTPSSDSIASVLKKVFMRFGVPEALYWDNGRDFRAEWFEGKHTNRGISHRISDLGVSMGGVMEMLGIRVHHAIIRRARSKIVEPCFLAIANFDKTLPEYCGHRPDARPEALEKLVEKHDQWLRGETQDRPFRTIEEIAWLYDEQLETINERPHQGEGMQKLTPTGRGWMSANECWQKLIGGIEQRKVSADVLQFAFQKRRKITVRHGEVQVSVHGKSFHYRLIDSPVQLVALNGREIEVAYDPLDLETVALYLEGRFLGFAANADLRGMGEADFVRDEIDRRAVRKAVKKYIQTVHQSIPMAGPEERAARRMAVRPARPVTEPSGPEVTVPAEITEAVEAAREDRKFSFAASSADLIRAADRASYSDDAEDGAFQFFQQESK